MQQSDQMIVYAIAGELTNRVKLGWTASRFSPKTRCKELQCGSPDKLTIIGFCRAPVQVETKLHRALKEHNTHNEWFSSDVTEQIRTWLADGCTFSSWVEQTIGEAIPGVPAVPDAVKPKQARGRPRTPWMLNR